MMAYGIDMTREALLNRLENQLSESRFIHVLNVEKTARDLANHYGEDPEKAALAGLLHDYAKEFPDSVFLDVIARHHLDADLKNWGNNIWHGVLGVYLLQEDLGLNDVEILQAIERHTVGSAQMTTLDKIVYLADYIEPERNFPGVERARELAFSNLDKAVAFATANTISHLVAKAMPIFPKTLETYNAYIMTLKEDKA